MNKGKNTKIQKYKIIFFFNLNGRVREIRQTQTNKNAKIKQINGQNNKNKKQINGEENPRYSDIFVFLVIFFFAE